MTGVITLQMAACTPVGGARLVDQRARHSGPLGAAPLDAPAGPPQGPPLPPWWSPQRGSAGVPRGPRRYSPPRRPAGPRHGSSRWSPPRRPARPPDDPKCWPLGPPVHDHRRSNGSWPPPHPSSCAHGYASAGKPWPTGVADLTGSWSSAWRPPPYPVFHRPALWSGEAPAKSHSGHAYQWALSTAQPQSAPSPLMLLPAPPPLSLQPTPQEPARQPLYVLGRGPAPQPTPQPTTQPTTQEAARQPLYVIGGHQAPPPSTVVLVPDTPQPAQQAPLYLKLPFQQ